MPNYHSACSPVFRMPLRIHVGDENCDSMDQFMDPEFLNSANIQPGFAKGLLHNALMADAEELEEPDVSVNCHKGQGGYGIYFTQTPTGGITVTKLDKGSQAEQSGVQVGDRLLRVQDLHNKLPPENPGGEIVVTKDNYQTTLDYVRAMKYCKLSFGSAPGGF